MAASSKTAPRRPRSATGGGGARKARSNARLAYDVTGIVFLALGLILLFSLLGSGGDGENRIGAIIASGLKLLVGAGAWLGPFLLIGIGGMLAIGRSRSWDNVGAAIALFLTLISWWHLGHVDNHGQFDKLALMTYGGYLGAGISWLTRTAIGTPGSHVLFLAGTAISLLFLTDVPLPVVLGPLARLLERSLKDSKSVLSQNLLERLRPILEYGENGTRLARKAEKREREPKQDGDTGRKPIFRRTTPEPEETGNSDDEEENEPSSLPTVRIPNFLKRSSTAVVTPVAVGHGADIDVPTPVRQPATEAPSPRETVTRSTVGGPKATLSYVAPPLNLLKPAVAKADPSEGESKENREILLQTLEDFGIGADIENIAYGPTVTRYEIALERGIKVSKIVSLADNLAMNMAAIDVRVEAPIPGKSAIGIEVPNAKTSVVGLRECLESPEFQNAPGKLTFVLGKDVTGAVRMADLAKMPHLLVGGATGSGKSVGLNVLISSLLYRCSPRELKFLMIDPKKVELSLYEGIPHLAGPVITNVKQAPSLFKQAIKEMELRYDKFAKAQTKNIEGYNAKVEEAERIPYWVIVVDELADLMMTSGPEIETYICRLAQLARATGIHLVIATQRPSVNVITGTIKANIPSRIAFAVNSAIDSRTILDQTGADRLIGRGDMLYMPMDAAKPFRIQGAWISEGETEAMTTHLKAQGQPQFEVLPSTLSSATGEDDSGEIGSDDELFESAVRLVATGGSASTSMLQRRFKIGYTRAARLVDMMEQKGIVGPLDGAKPRDILVSRDDVDEMFNARDRQLDLL
ncbi:MAG: DNA translocase FtsK [Armatimonas sp.]